MFRTALAGLSRSALLVAVLATGAGAACSDNAGGPDGAVGTVTGDAAALDAAGTNDGAGAAEISADAAGGGDAKPPKDAVPGDMDASKDAGGPALTLASIEPSQGKATGGETITLAGAGFAEGMQVLFGGAPLDPQTVIVIDEGTCNVTTPPHQPGLVDVTVNLALDGGATKLSSTLPKAFLYFNEVVITAIEPAEGPTQGGTPLTLSGTGFLGQTQVLIGGKMAIGVQVVADDQILAVTPPGPFGASPVHVSNERGVGVVKKGFFYTSAPTVDAVVPGAGPVKGGTVATIKGSGFTAKSTFQIGDATATPLEIPSATQAVVSVPAGEAGPANVVATNPWGTGTLAQGFFYLNGGEDDTTKILGVAPPSGPLAGGNSIVIAATGLSGTEDTTVLVGAKKAPIVQVSAAQNTVVVKAPAGVAPGPVDIALTSPKGTATAKGAYSYVQALAITSISPATGPASGNTTVKLTGSGFAKGALSLTIGALPASAVAVLDDGAIEAVTPPGSPGYAGVTVTAGTESATLSNGFFYASEGMQLAVVFPETGAIAGGTHVHLFGSGLSANSKVTFAGAAATHIEFVSPTEITCKTPPGKVGAADVSVSSAAGSSTLANAYTYFNPLSLYGGTWGGSVDGSINLTVLDAQAGTPVAEAFAMIGHDPKTPYQGFTNEQGQLTFSGDDLTGKQEVHVSKKAYESGSVIAFNAENITIYITPIPPPSSGPPPPGVAPGQVSGKVSDIEKYTMLPPGKCDIFAEPPPGATPQLCKPCSIDAQCGFGTCLDLPEQGKYCGMDCTTSSCPTGYSCIPQNNGAPQCAPKAGELTAVCYHSQPSVFSQHLPAEGPGFEANLATGWKYTITTGLGEMAIVCFAGYKEPGAKLDLADAQSMLQFHALSMGVKRHIFVQEGEKKTDVNVSVKIPLLATARLHLDDPPEWDTGGNYLINAAFSFLVFGSDGAIEMPGSEQKFVKPFKEVPTDQLMLKGMPNAFTDEIFDASLTFYTIVVEFDPLTKNQYPNSVNLMQDVKQLNDDSMLLKKKDATEFSPLATGIQSNLNGLWGMAVGSLFAVGEGGLIVAFDGGGWTQQFDAKLVPGDFKAIHGSGAQTIWAVGTKGSAAHFDGTTWQPGDLGGADANAVYIADVLNGWAGTTSGLYRMQDGATWTPYFESGLSINALGLHGSGPDDVWAVGMTGKIAHWDGKSWKMVPSGTSIALRAVHALSPGEAWAVGEAGQILKWNGAKWSPVASPVKTTLTSVHALGGSDVWVAGAKGVILHGDGTTWSKLGVADVGKQLNAVWADTEGAAVALGQQELLLTPFVSPPKMILPLKDGVLKGSAIKWKVDPPGVEPHFTYLTIGIPGMGGDTPVWNMMIKGSLFEADLPDFPNIQGTPGIPMGTPLHMTIIRGYKEGFDIDHFDNYDLNQMTWQSWALDSFYFTRE